VTQAVTQRLALEKRTREQEDQIAALKQRFSLLEERQKSLLEANDELATTNAELRGTIQELNIHAEEAAAANEEIATLNEEMQATNEQLETLNEELHAANEELNTTNDELHRRGAELEAAGKSYDGRLARSQEQQEALEALIERLEPFAVLRDDDTLIYGSTPVADWIGTQAGDWWKANGRITIQGKEYVLVSSDIARGQQRYRLIEFKHAAGGIHATVTSAFRGACVVFPFVMGPSL
jgi:chromosome segregation ATPase